MRTKNKFYLLLTGIFLILTACSESPIEQENPKKSSETIESQNSILIENIINDVVNDIHVQKNITQRVIPSTQLNTSIFTFKNLKNQASILKVKNDIYNFSNIEQPIVMIVLASTWCPPCRGQVPHLSSLQKKFKENLFIIAALIHDDIKEEELQKLIISEKVNFYVSTEQKENLKFSDMISNKLGIVNKLTLPLMVLFANGQYFTHYEGSMPEEMIESDIKQLLKKLKNQKMKDI